MGMGMMGASIFKKGKIEAKQVGMKRRKREGAQYMPPQQPLVVELQWPRSQATIEIKGCQVQPSGLPTSELHNQAYVKGFVSTRKCRFGSTNFS